jgi:hypothetical protein
MKRCKCGSKAMGVFCFGNNGKPFRIECNDGCRKYMTHSHAKRKDAIAEWNRAMVNKKEKELDVVS